MTSENRLSLDDALRHDRPTIDDESLAHLLESQMDSYAPDLPMSGLENESIVNQNATDGTDMTASDRIRGLLRDPSEHTDASGTQPEPTNAHVNPNQSDIDTDVHIKEESPGLEIISSKFIPGEIIDLSDTEDVAIKQEAESAPFNWTSMPAGSIMISDSDDEDEAVARANKLPSAEDPAKASPVRDLAVDIGRNMDELGENDIPRVTSAPHLGKFMLNKKLNSPAKPQPQDMADLRERQRASLEKALGNPIITGAGGIFKVPQPSISSASRMPDDDGFSWMTDTMVLDDEPAIDFQALKKSYKAKRKARANTLEDDIQFKKAHIEATNLLRKQALEMAEHDTSDEAEESEDGLFVREEPSLSRTKTPFSMSADSRADNDDVVFTGMLTGKRPSRQPNNKSSANEPEFSTKRSRANALKRELRSNMMAGIEAILLKDQRRLELQTAKAAEAEDKAQGKKTSHKRKTSTTLVGTSAKRTKTGRMSNVDSLMNSNIYEDSNANLDKPGLPQVTDKKKADFLTSLIANIPLEDWNQANDDRIDIVRASRILAKYKVVPDGKGDWAFKGMKSSLYHYQLQGAAYMKSREIGEQNPHGGILAGKLLKSVLFSSTALVFVIF